MTPLSPPGSLPVNRDSDPSNKLALIGWLFWFLAALFYAYEFIHRIVPSILTTELRAAFNINERELGQIGALYFYAYAALQIPAGLLLDKFGTKKILVLASLVLTVGSFIFSTTNTYFIAQIARIMIGAGSAFAFISCLNIGAAWLSPRYFPLMVGLTNLCGTLGALSAGAPFSYVVEYLGWRAALLYLSVAGIAITALIALFLKDKKIPISLPAKPVPLFQALIQVIKHPQSWLIGIYGALLVAPIVALPEMWGVEYLSLAYQLSTPSASLLTHTIFIGTALGGPLLGWLMPYFPHKHYLMMGATLCALLLLITLLYYLNLSHAFLYAVLFAYGLFTANMLLCFTLISKVHPLKIQGTALGFINMLIMGFGGLAQYGIGFILTPLRERHEGVILLQDYQFALSILPVCLVIALILSFRIKSTLQETL